MVEKRKHDDQKVVQIESVKSDPKIEELKIDDKLNLDQNENQVEHKTDPEDGSADDDTSTTDITDSEPGSSDDELSEYNSTDSSDEEDNRYTIGNIPMKWYEDLQHAGYDLDGKQISKPVKSDELDKLVEKMSNPDFWRTIQDPLSGKKQVLNSEEIEMLSSLRYSSTVKTATSLDPHADWEDIYSHEKMQTAIDATNPSKKSFIPSLLDKKKVGHLVHLIKAGKYNYDLNVKKEKTPLYERTFGDLWKESELNDNNDDKTKSQMARLKMSIPAPKAKLPGHVESYRPPVEYLFDEKEQAEWEELDEKNRKINFLPKIHESLRHVNGYDRFINERFERCLDLYLCPRQRKMKMNIDPESLIPKLPKPKDLQPFPIDMLAKKWSTFAQKSMRTGPEEQGLKKGA